MLRPRHQPEAETVPGQARTAADPLTSITAFLLALIALGLLVAGFLAVYTYSTPAVEVPLVVGISLAFSAVLAINIVGLSLRHLRAGRW